VASSRLSVLRSSYGARVADDATYGVLTKKRAVVWITLMAAAALAAACLVGFESVGKGFDWNAAGVAATAVGTVLLAGFTGALAWTTSGDVRATWELTRLTREDQLARERPLVIVQAVRYDRARGTDNPPTHHGVLHVEFFNAGAGPAVDIRVRGRTGVGGTVEERTLDALPADGRFPFALVVRPADANHDVWTVDNFILEGDCTDRNESKRYPLRYTYSMVPLELQ
jgi:hypothetical protein